MLKYFYTFAINRRSLSHVSIKILNIYTTFVFSFIRYYLFASLRVTLAIA